MITTVIIMIAVEIGTKVCVSVRLAGICISGDGGYSAQLKLGG